MTSDFLPVDRQLEILTRGAVDIQVPAELKSKLERSHKENKPLVVKVGFDPTAPDLHLGHAVLITKMRQFQDLGHEVVFLIGDFTARVGDPSGKNTTRPPLGDDEIISNATTYKNQVFKILDKEKTVVKYNSEWLKGMGFDDVIKLAAKYSVARMLERDDFSKRLKEQRPISMHELLYPLVQGYDSVALNADVELGGTDQLFNLLVGRDLMRHFHQEPQCVLTMPILEGIEAREENGLVVGDKMSKSLGNYIGIEEDPGSQFGKIMSICDALMWRYYDLLSLRSSEEIKALKSGHPKEAKIALAKEIVTRFHDEAAAEQAQDKFKELFGAGNRNEVPKDAPGFKFAKTDTNIPIVRILVESELAPSNSEAKRLLKQGSVSIDGIRIKGLDHALDVGEYALRVGKKRWAKIVIGGQ